MAHPRAERRLTRRPLTGPWALAPALVVLGLLLAAGLGYAVAQSLGALPLTGEPDIGLQAYRDLFGGTAGPPDLWASTAFTLWVSAASTLLAAAVALLFIAWLERPRGPRRRWATGVLHLNLAIPHVVWAVALLLVVSQSGVIARLGATVGLVDSPGDFPALVRDPYGVGLILHFATKEMPFLVLVGLALMRAQPRQLVTLADTLGARGFRRVRLLIVPTVLPGLAVAGALVFAFVFGSYEAAVVLGADSPRVLSIVGLDLFNSPDLRQRPVGMALGVLMTLFIACAVWGATAIWARRRT